MKDTTELEKVLKSTHLKDAEHFLEENKESMYMGDNDFSAYMRDKLKEKGIRQQDVFLYADIPERYGYKIMSGEKHTRQRDVILRICYAAELSLEETQKALRIYGLPELYAKVPRDAVLMIAFNTRPGGIIEVNQFLRDKKIEPLRTSGLQD
ncbi:MAG: hypothetical protein K6B14_09500 [Lachnospiraceae bacterium]|nr:hypothetical protein [Lachnospiraceae bacterium]